MKKFLSLVLALVMTMSLVTISAGAKDFTDNDKVTYNEAVDVISALGIVDGYADGSFKPTNTLTRGAAAKIICNLLLGPSVASTLSATSAPFKDVPVTNTFAGYITYVAQQGIINGYEDGTFKPGNTLTGYAYMKMLLGALGYSSSNENFTGNNWTINVATKIAKNGLADGNDDFVGTKAVTREEAALYAFNMGNAKAVYYTNTNKITINGVTIEQGGTLVEPDPNGTAPTFFDNAYGTALVRSNAGADATDAFYRPSHKWTYKTKTIGTYNDEPVKSYVGPVKSITIYKDLGLSETKTAPLYINGSAAGEATFSRANTTDYVTNSYGTTTEIYKIGTAYRAIQINTFGAEVVKVNPAKAATATADAVDRSVTLNVFGLVGGTRRMDFTTEQFAAGDIVAVTVSALGTLSVESAAPTTTVQGKVEKYTSSSITINGTTYNVGVKSNVKEVIDSGNVNFTAESVYYVDSNNVVVYSGDVSTVSTDYVYVEKTQVKNTAATLFDTAGVSVKAQVVFTDGSHSVIDLALTKVANGYTVAMPANDSNGDAVVTTETIATSGSTTPSQVAAQPVGNWFAYVKNADGTYTLTTVAPAYASVKNGQSLNANAATSVGGGLVTTSETKIVTVDADYKLSTITGFPAVAGNLTGKVLVTYAKGSSKVAAIYAVGQAAPATATSYAYAVQKGATTANGTEWTFAVDGELKTFVIAGTQPVAGSVYTLTSGSNGTYGVSTPVTVVEIAGTVSVADLSFFQTKVVSADGSSTTYYGPYTYATNVKVYNVSDTVEDFGKADVVEVGDTVSVIYTGTGADAKVAVVYITAEAEA